MFSDLSSKSAELEVLVKRVLKVKKEKTIKEKKIFIDNKYLLQSYIHYKSCPHYIIAYVTKAAYINDLLQINILNKPFAGLGLTTKLIPSSIHYYAVVYQSWPQNAVKF